jgi:DNA-binding CsgD family transcriptional regulator
VSEEIALAWPGTRTRLLQDHFIARPVSVADFARWHSLDHEEARAVLRAQRPLGEPITTAALVSLACAAAGWPRKQTARELGLTAATISNHLARATKILAAPGIPAAVHTAYATGLLTPPSPRPAPRQLTRGQRTVLVQLVLTRTERADAAGLRDALAATSAEHAITRAWAYGFLDATTARHHPDPGATGPVTAAAVQQHLVERPRPVGDLARELGITPARVLDLLRTRQPPAGGLTGLQRVIAAYLAAGWTREEAGTELGLAYRGVAHHVVRARVVLGNAPDEPSLIHRALRSGALPVPRGLPAPRRTPTTGEQSMLADLAHGTGPVRGRRPDTLSSLITALDARTPTHTIALGWAAGLLGPHTTTVPSTPATTHPCLATSGTRTSGATS